LDALGTIVIFEEIIKSPEMRREIFSGLEGP
jgi:hypothetical protein